MKYILLIIGALAVVFVLSFLICGLVRRKMKKKLPKKAHVLISLGAGILVFVIVSTVYLCIHYSPEEEALAVMNDDSGVTVTQIDGAYFIDGERSDRAFIFYPGAKVDSEAYLPLMKRLAEGGNDCFLIRSPLRRSLLDTEAAKKIIDAYDYKHVVVAGHSMGGLAASKFAAAHPDQVDGLVLLAAYPASKLSDDIPLQVVYGSEDKIMDMEAFVNARQYYPVISDEYIVEGGNHAQFGNYGEMPSDGKATISTNQQQIETVAVILVFEDINLR